MIRLQEAKVTCSNCDMRGLCMPVGLSDDEMTQIDRLVSSRLRMQRGEHIYHRQ